MHPGEMANQKASIMTAESRWWFSPAKISEAGNDLLPGAIKIHSPGSVAIKKSGIFSIDMRGAFINKSYDDNEGLRSRFKQKGTNDLLIVTSFQTGTSPTVQRVHFLRQEQKINEFVGDFFKTMVCSFSDFQDNHITLQTQVYDIDNYDKINDIVSAASSMAGNAVGTFPVIGPYIAAGKAVASSMLELINQLNKHDPIIDSNLRLVITEEENAGYQILQTGHWVCFSEPQQQEGGNLRLDPHLRIVRKDTTTGGEPFRDSSYAIYSVRAEGAQEPGWEIDQKIAKLLSELDGKGNSGRAAVDFLRDTMEGYTKFKKITRYQELLKKDKLTEEEKKVFEKLRNDESIKEFIKGLE